uniref:Uncharacterized protein n=1 Tax=Oryza brachyantha TaxID=4533 RepID=J3MU37_ORYBR
MHPKSISQVISVSSISLFKHRSARNVHANIHRTDDICICIHSVRPYNNVRAMSRWGILRGTRRYREVGRREPLIRECKVRKEKIVIDDIIVNTIVLER